MITIRNAKIDDAKRILEMNDEYLTMNSIQFHTHLGFTRVGEFHKCGYKFGRWYHMTWMEKIIGEHKENQLAVKKYL